MKSISVLLLSLLFWVIPHSGFSIIFVKIDEKGNHYYSCEGTSGHTISIKKVDKNLFKVLGNYIGKTVNAASETEAAILVCDEGSKPPQQNASP